MTCRWWRHRWSKWKVINEGNVRTKGALELEFMVTGAFVEQRRECLDCGKLQIRIAKS